MNDACAVIMKRLEDLREASGNFPKDTMRWANVKFDTEFQGKNVHVSDLDFRRTTQEELVNIFETVLVRVWRQM